MAALLVGLLPMSVFAGTATDDFNLSMSASAVDGSGNPRECDSLTAGDTVTVSVTIPSGIAVCSMAVHLNFDNTLFKCTNVGFGSALTTPTYNPGVQSGWSAHEFSSAATANTNGYAAVFAAYKNSEGEIANTTTSAATPTVCTVTFTVNSGVSGTASFTVDAIEILYISSFDPVTGEPVTEPYSVSSSAPVAAAIPEALSGVSLNALDIDFGETAVTSVSGTGFLGSVAWSGVTGGGTISSAGAYTATVTLTPDTANHFAFSSGTAVTYGGTVLGTTANTVNNCSVRITGRTASQIVFTVTRTLTAPVTAGTTYTVAASAARRRS